MQLGINSTALVDTGLIGLQAGPREVFHMRAIYLEEPRKLLEREIPVPILGDGQVMVRIKAVGICGSDVHYWHKGKIGSFIVKKPLVLGHECSGTIVGVGKNVKRLRTGDRVVIEPGTPCYKGEYCMSGRYNLCHDIAFFATPPHDGCLLEYVAFDENLVYQIPETIDDYAVATLVEPMAVGVFATGRLRPKLGEKAIVFGAGVIGISCLLAAKAAGCAEVCVADIRDDRLSKMKAFGADRVLNLSREKPGDSAFDIAYEATGADACYATAAYCVKPGGRLSMVGMGGETQNIPLVDYVCREIEIVTSFRYANVYRDALRMVEKNKDVLADFITHRLPFSLENVEKAFHIAFSDQSAGKVVVEF
jgi:L-iditol 2-dehydrogenase